MSTKAIIMSANLAEQSQRLYLLKTRPTDLLVNTVCRMLVIFAVLGKYLFLRFSHMYEGTTMARCIGIIYFYLSLKGGGEGARYI